MASAVYIPVWLVAVWAVLPVVAFVVGYRRGRTDAMDSYGKWVKRALDILEDFKAKRDDG